MHLWSDMADNDIHASKFAVNVLRRVELEYLSSSRRSEVSVSGDKLLLALHAITTLRDQEHAFGSLQQNYQYRFSESSSFKAFDLPRSHRVVLAQDIMVVKEMIYWLVHQQVPRGVVDFEQLVLGCSKNVGVRVFPAEKHGVFRVPLVGFEGDERLAARVGEAAADAVANSLAVSFTQDSLLVEPPLVVKLNREFVTINVLMSLKQDDPVVGRVHAELYQER